MLVRPNNASSSTRRPLPALQMLECWMKKQTNDVIRISIFNFFFHGHNLKDISAVKETSPTNLILFVLLTARQGVGRRLVKRQGRRRTQQGQQG